MIEYKKYNPPLIHNNYYFDLETVCGKFRIESGFLDFFFKSDKCGLFFNGEKIKTGTKEELEQAIKEYK